MTIQRFKTITEQLPPDTIVLIDVPGVDELPEEVTTITIEYHSDGRAHLLLGNKD